MHLFYKPGACSMAAHIVLNEAAAPHTRESVDTVSGTTETGMDFNKVNPRGYVPALRLDDGDVITENAAVLQFLGDKFPQISMVPQAGTKERVRLQEALSFLSSELHIAFGPFFVNSEMSDEKKKATTERLKGKIAQFDAMMADANPYILGKTFSVADAYAFVILNWSNFIGVSLEGWPRLVEFMTLVGSRPAVQQTLQEEGLVA